MIGLQQVELMLAQEIGVAFQLLDIPRLLANALTFAAVVLAIETVLV